MDFQTFHKYNRLVRRNVARPIICDVCSDALVVMAGKDDEPVLRCFVCGSVGYPSLELYRQVSNIVEDYYGT
jgi:uncharacterized Zn finger protein